MSTLHDESSTARAQASAPGPDGDREAALSEERKGRLQPLLILLTFAIGLLILLAVGVAHLHSSNPGAGQNGPSTTQNTHP